MIKKYYIDTSIWIDVYEDRIGYKKEPLGDFAWRLLSLIKSKNYKIVISDLLIRELESNYSAEEMTEMMLLFKNQIEKINVTKKHRDETKKIAKERNILPGDVLHAIVSRDHNHILITKDKHFLKITDICKYFKPEEIT